MSRIPRVAILVQNSTEWGQGVIRGIAEYMTQHGPWLIFIEPRGLYEQLTLPEGWRGDGIIARVNHEGLLKQLEEIEIPVVNVSWSNAAPPDMPRVTSDEMACGDLAAKHFVMHGFRHFAYCGPIDRPDYTNDKVGKAFRDAVEKAGYSCSSYAPPRGKLLERWYDRMQNLALWLSKLPRPVAMLAWNDARAREVIEACRMTELRVPEDLAILTAEQDPIMAELSTMPISSLNCSARRVGYEAAEMLATLMKGQTLKKREVLVPPVGVIQRRSTDIIAIDDEELAAALIFIRDNAHRPIQVEDILDAVPLSRRALELHFQQKLGRTPADEIRRVRLERAKQLLIDTELPLAQVAKRCGYNHVQVLIRNFKRVLGMTPDQFRKHTGPWRRG